MCIRKENLSLDNEFILEILVKEKFNCLELSEHHMENLGETHELVICGGGRPHLSGIFEDIYGCYVVTFNSLLHLLQPPNNIHFFHE
jgi:hypothetical protein